MSILVRRVLAVTLSVFLIGCDAKSNDEKRAQAVFDPTPDAGDLGFVHALADGPDLRIVFAGSNGGSDQFELGFGQARQASQLVGGYNVQVTYTDAGGSTVTLLERVGDNNIKLFPDDEITVVLAGTLADPKIFLVENPEYLYGIEDPANIQESPQIQFMHTVSGRGTLDFYLTGSGDDLAGATPVTLSFGAVSALQDIDAGSAYRVRVVPAGQPDTVLYDSGSTAFNTNTRALLGAFPYFGPAAAQLRLKRIRNVAAAFPNEPYPAWYRATHLVADVPETDLYLGATSGTPVLSAQPFAQVSPYQQRARGTVTTNLTVAGSPGDVLFSDALGLQAGDATSIFVAGLRADADTNPIGIAALEDIRAIPGYAQVRAVHGSPSGVPLNVYLLRPGETTSGKEPLLALEYGGTRSRTVGAGDRNLVVESTGGSVLIGPERITLSETSSYTLLLTDAPGGGSPLNWTLVPGPVTVD